MLGLSRSGIPAALAVGVLVVAGGSWRYAAVLLAFFVTSMALSRAGKRRKEHLAEQGKGGPRNAFQVLANGGIAAACAIAARLGHSPPLAAAFAGACAAAAADTWGTEIGTLFAVRPRSVLSGKALAPGLSGGITLPGTIAEAAGGAFVGIVAQAAGVAPWWVVAGAGLAGAFADSFAGAGAQELRYCDRCGRACEVDPHGCGAPTRRIRGVGWMTNDSVNVICTAVGAAAGAALFLLARR